MTFFHCVVSDDCYRAGYYPATATTCLPLNCGMRIGSLEAFWRLVDAREEIAAVNEFMSSNAWRGAPRRNACTEPCDNWNGPCVCGAWHKDGK